jgi:hypothetical protein
MYSITDLFNNKVVIFPDEIDTSGCIKYDLTKLNNSQELIASELEDNEIDSFISLRTYEDSGYVLKLATLFNKDVLYINPETGFPRYGNKKLNYKLKYVLWIDTIGYNLELFNGLEKLSKRGLRIKSIVTLIDCHEGVSLLIKELFPNAKYKSIYELYNLLAIFEGNKLITNFLVEKCKFNADKNRKLTNRYVENYLKMKNGSYEYMKNPSRWYIDNYLTFNNLLEQNVIIPDYNNIVLTYIKEYNWTDIEKELICYGKNVNKVVINPQNITNLNLEVLYKLQRTYNFNVIEYKYYANTTLLDTRDLSINKYNNKNISTLFDGLIYSINLTSLNDTKYKNDLIHILTQSGIKVLLYVNVVNVNDIKLLQDLILYSNEYMNSCIQGVIFDYEQVKNMVFDKKIRLYDLIPLILNINEITVDIKYYFTDNNYTSLMLSMDIIPMERRGFNWFNSFLRNNQEDIANIINTDIDLRDKLHKECSVIRYKLANTVKKEEENNESYSKIRLLNYISPFSWYNYFLGH